MINIIGKNLNNDEGLPYYTSSRLSKEEAIELLSDNTKIIIAFHEGVYTITWYTDCDFYGIYCDEVSKVLVGQFGMWDEALQCLTLEAVDKLKMSMYVQRFDPHGWMRFFNDPEDIRLQEFRVYDLYAKPVLVKQSLDIPS